MSMQTLYIEQNDEITTVIERLKSAHEPVIALVVPKGALLLQSIVNLKLARKAALDAQKDLVLVTTDSVGKNLAAQLGILVANTEKEVPGVLNGSIDAPDLGAEPAVISGVRIHRYYDEPDTEANPAMNASDQALTPLVPRSVTETKPELPVKQVTPAQPSIDPGPITRKNIPADVGLNTRTIETAQISTAEPEPFDLSNPIDRTPKVAGEKSTVSSTAPSVAATASTAAVAAGSAIQPTANRTVTNAAANTPTQKPAKKRRTALWISLILIIVIAGSTVFAATVYYPKTTVVLSVRGEVITRELAFTARRGVDTASPDLAIIPAEEIQVESSKSVAGKATAAVKLGENAVGTATLVNSQDTDSVTLPIGTIIKSDSGRTFSTTASAIVPGLTVRAGIPINGTTTVAIKAEQVGTESNLENAGATIISGSSTRLFAQITKTTGGSSREAIVAGEADFKAAQAQLEKDLREELVKKLAERTTGRSIIRQQSADRFEISQGTSSVKIGAEVADFTLEATGKLTALVVDQTTLLRTVESRLKQGIQIPGEFTLDQAVTLTNEQTSIPDGVYSFVLAGKGVVSPTLATDKIGSNVAGRSQVDAEALIRRTNPAVNGVRYTVEPDWWPLKKLPSSPSRITVVTTYE
jgi:hypothetical protein